MDDKSIEKTTSALNGHGIAGDDPTIGSPMTYRWLGVTLWGEISKENTIILHKAIDM